jgi:hypothetical protein
VLSCAVLVQHGQFSASKEFPVQHCSHTRARPEVRLALQASSSLPLTSDSQRTAVSPHL